LSDLRSPEPVHTVTTVVQGKKRTFSAPAGANLLAAAIRHQVRLDHICRVGVCGACQVIVGSADECSNPPTPEEKAFLGAEPLSQGVRLACQVKVRGDLVIRQ